MNEGGVQSVAFSPDGRTVAAGFFGGITGGVVLWDVAGQERVMQRPLAVKEGDVLSVTFSPDGETVAAGFGLGSLGGGGGSGGVVLWDVNLKSWERIARRVANRNMTEGEWHQFIPNEIDYHATFPDLPARSRSASRK